MQKVFSVEDKCCVLLFLSIISERPQLRNASNFPSYVLLSTINNVSKYPHGLLHLTLSTVRRAFFLLIFLFDFFLLPATVVVGR